MRRHPWLAILGQAVRTPRGATGLGLAGFVVAVAIAGPVVAPHSPHALLTFPFAKPSGPSRSAPTSSAAMCCPGCWTAAGCCC